MTAPRPRSASITVMPRQIDPDTPDATRWYSDAEPVTVHTLDARLARIETMVQQLLDKELSL
jgi:hypothetical protein